MKLNPVGITLIAVVLVGCATPSKNLNRVSVGMTKTQVIELLGEPQSARATQGVEYLIYRLAEGFSVAGAPHEVRSSYFVGLRNGVVDSYGRLGDFDSTRIPESKHTIDLNVHED